MTNERGSSHVADIHRNDPELGAHIGRIMAFLRSRGAVQQVHMARAK